MLVMQFITGATTSSIFTVSYEAQLYCSTALTYNIDVRDTPDRLEPP